MLTLLRCPHCGFRRHVDADRPYPHCHCQEERQRAEEVEELLRQEELAFVIEGEDHFIAAHTEVTW